MGTGTRREGCPTVKVSNELYLGEVAVSMECLLGGHWDKEGRMPDCQSK